MVTPPPILSPPQHSLPSAGQDGQDSIETVGLDEHNDDASFQAPTRERNRFEGVVAFLVSSTVHIVLLLMLALIVKTSVFDSPFVMVLSTGGADEDSTSLEVMNFSALELPAADDALGEPASESVAQELWTLADVSEVKIPPPESSTLATTSDRAADRNPLKEKETETKKGVEFFGTHAYGDSFVYVLDVSGSMSGRRMQRARAELIRSINGLQPDHSFYVVLYSTNAITMFRERVPPRMRPATRDNKEKVARWIMKVHPQGGTFPANALKIAGDLSPDAVFFLSDGEFVYGENLGFNSAMERFMQGFVKARPGLNGNHPMVTPPHKVLSEYDPKIVVHTIALESESSRLRMESIAEWKGGEHRFIPSPEAMKDSRRRRAISR